LPRSAEAYASKMTHSAQARNVESTGFAAIDQVFQASPMARRAVFVAGVALVGSIELGVIASGQALLLEGALALTFLSLVFVLASVARHSKVVSLLMPWLLWTLSLVVVAVVLAVICSLLLEWPLRFPILQ
jgi:hypothetical protein